MAAQTAAGALSRSLYPTAIALCLFPLNDMMGRLFPMHLENVQWRFGALGLVFGGTLVMLVLGLTLLGFVAVSRKHSSVLAAVAAVATTVAVLMAVALVVFALDAVQLRATVREELKASMATAAASAAIGALLTISALVGLAVAAVRARRALRFDAGAGDRAPAIVMS